jgi:hypothetical protein
MFISDLKTADIKGVVYLHATPGPVTGVRFYMKNGGVNEYQGEDLLPALSVAKRVFGPQADETSDTDKDSQE